MIMEEEAPQRDLKQDDLVRISGLRNATYLNDRIGRVVVSSSPPKDGRVGVQFVDMAEPKSIKVENLELMDKERHFHFVKKDIPGMGFLDPENRNIEIQIRIENGRGKNCVECSKDLENQYHVQYKGQWLCEEDYVRKCVGENHPIFRVCALCYKYIPFAELKGLPRGLFEKKYPNGKLLSGIQIGCPTDEPDKYDFFAHRRCFVCHLCDQPMYIPELNPHGFLCSLNSEATFLCKGPPGSTSFCSERYPEVVKARKRLNEIESLSVEELRQLLTERGVHTSDEEDTKSLVNKVVVTDSKRGRKIAHIVEKRSRDDEKDMDTPGAFADNCCTVKNCGGCDKNDFIDEKVVSSRVQPGSDLIDQRCTHGCPESMQCWDDQQRARKRTAMSKYMQSSEYYLFYMSEEQCRKNLPDWDAQIDPATGQKVTPFMNACYTFCNYWYLEEREALLSDLEEKFIPRFMWNVAVSSACEEDGSHDYVTAAVAASLIIAEMIKWLANNQLPIDGVVGNALNKDTGIVIRTMMSLIRKGTLFKQLKQIEAGPESLYQFMNSPALRRCDCMKYVATAASIGRLRLKDSKVKNVKHYCAVCNKSLAQPKFCSLCFEVPYCDRDHQREHWRVHKKVCKGHKKGGK